MEQLQNPSPMLLPVSMICGDTVVDTRGEDLGQIEELMIDLESGRIAYAVLSLGGLLGFSDKLFAIPFGALRLDAESRRFILDLPRDRLERAPGFDKTRWPDFADPDFAPRVYRYYVRSDG